MASVDTSAPVTLIAPQRQTLWGWPAVANFTLGGLGAGFYAAAAVAAGLGASPALTLAAWLGPALVLAGFMAVATEAGRPLRGPRVLSQLRTSWMSLELWLGLVFTGLALCEFVLGTPALRAGATLVALGLALAQGGILREARGVAAWDVPLMPLVFLSSALMSGVGLLVLLAVARGLAPTDRLLAVVLILLIGNMLVWQAFLGWSREDAFLSGTRPLREGWTRTVTVGGGYLAPALLIALALAFPNLAGPALAVVGALMLWSQAHAKGALILRAGELRPISISHLRWPRRPV